MTGDILQSRSRITVWLRRFRTPIIYIETAIKTDPFKVLYGVEGYVVDDLTELCSKRRAIRRLTILILSLTSRPTGFSSIKDAKS